MFCEVAFPESSQKLFGSTCANVSLRLANTYVEKREWEMLFCVSFDEVTCRDNAHQLVAAGDRQSPNMLQRHDDRSLVNARSYGDSD